MLFGAGRLRVLPAAEAASGGGEVSAWRMVAAARTRFISALRWAGVSFPSGSGRRAAEARGRLRWGWSQLPLGPLGFPLLWQAEIVFQPLGFIQYLAQSGKPMRLRCQVFRCPFSSQRRSAFVGAVIGRVHGCDFWPAGRAVIHLLPTCAGNSLNRHPPRFNRGISCCDELPLGQGPSLSCIVAVRVHCIIQPSSRSP